MNNEIKEILDYFKNDIEFLEEELKNPNFLGRYITIRDKECSYLKLLLDYITNLQEELEDLREEDWAWHQTLKMQNQREYRSKFLKEFQEEFGKNVFPDYDEIYKRYDKLKKENEKLKERIEYLERSNNRREDTIISLRNELYDKK